MSTEESGSPSPFARRGFIVAAIVVVAILALGVFVIVSNALKPAAEPPPATPTSEPPVVSTADASVCGLEAFETKSSLSQAPDAEWELVGTIAAPTDPAVGPGTVDDGFRSCFAHTAEGALFATINYFALSSDARTLPRISELIESGPGKTAAENATAGDPSGNARLQVAGFKVNSYSAEEAVIDVAWSVTSSGGQLVSLPIVMHWADGDWKVELTDKGELPFTSAPLQNLGGYIPWAGV